MYSNKKLYLIYILACLFTKDYRCLAQLGDMNCLSSYTDSYRSDKKHGTILATLDGHSRSSCAMSCLRTSLCRTAILDDTEGTCFLSTLKQSVRKAFKRMDPSSPGYESLRFFHMQMLGPEVGKRYAPSYHNKIFKNCHVLKKQYPDAPSGIYRLNPVRPSSMSQPTGKPTGSPTGNPTRSPRTPFQAYCDQTTDGGGWTLVWSYTFTNYGNFDSNSNAVTPLPKWTPPMKSCDVPVSVTTPLGEDKTGAMLFALWSKIGKHFLIKSNIMNWISCSPGTGSLVAEVDGSIKCRVVRNLAGKCGYVVPKYINRQNRMCGPRLVLRRRPGHGGRPPKPPRPPPRCPFIYIEFNGRLSRGWPVHDSCGQCKLNHVKGVAMPRGYIYIR